MRSKLATLAFVLIMLFVNGQIALHEQKHRQGQTLILELAPLDPRSLIQGDYMILRYALASEIQGQEGVVYLRTDERGLVSEVLARETTGALKLKYRRLDGQVKFGIESYLFQEGKRAVYEKARYAELKVDEMGHPSLIRLLTDQLKPIGEAPQS